MSELFPELHAYERVEPSEDTPRWSPATQTLLDELGGRASPGSSGDPEQAQVYSEHETRLFRPGIAAGPESLARFEQALGLVGKLRSLKRTEGQSIEFVAEVDRAGTLARGMMTPPGELSWKQGETFNVGYTGDYNPVIAKALMRFMARYDGAPWQLILDQIVPAAGDEHMDANDYPESVFYAFASASAWRRFFEGTELYRGASGARAKQVATIDHADIECVFSEAPLDPRLPHFFNIPTIEEPERGSHEAEGNGPRKLMMFTDIGDVDVIKGADVLVDEALEYLADLGHKPTSVVIQAGCLPEVTGDDIEASAARTHERLRLPVIAVGQHNDVPGASFGDRLGTRTFDPERELAPHGIALLGMPSFVGRRDLIHLLEAAGVQVMTELFPTVPDDAIAQISRASVFVAYPWDRYAVTIARLGQRMAPARLLQPQPPFGLEGTRRWLLSIGAAVDRRAEVEAVIDETLAPLTCRWSQLRARARKLRVGFVVDHANWRAALSNERSLGVPMIEILGEMGFGIDILAYASGRSTPPEQRFDSIRVRSYRSIDELDAALAEPGVAAWYSEMHYDRRLSRNGKNSFSMRQFAMGLEGALTSLEDMLRVANMSFYRRYSRYLGPAFIEREQAGGPR